MDIIIPYIKKSMKDEGLLFNEKVISYDIADEKDDDSFYYTKPMVCGSDFVCNTSKYNIIVDSNIYNYFLEICSFIETVICCIGRIGEDRNNICTSFF